VPPAASATVVISIVKRKVRRVTLLVTAIGVAMLLASRMALATTLGSGKG
jgi:hypothetical protein